MIDPVERFLEDNADGDGVVRDYAAAADALLAAGLLSADRAEHWKAEHARCLAVGHGHAGPYDEGVEERAVGLLEALHAAVHPRSSDEWDPATYRRYQDALSTLTGIGALSHERARPWCGRQSEALAPAGGWPPGEPEPEIPFVAGELSAVVAGAEQRRGGMRVTFVELYGDCVVLRFHQLLPPEPDDPVEARKLLGTAFELEDDRGTAYEPVPIPTPRGCRPRTLERWPEALTGWCAFVPGAPLDAATMMATWGDRRFPVPLRTG